MTAEELRQAINEAFDAADDWYSEQLAGVTNEYGLARPEDIDRIHGEFADRIEALSRPLMRLARVIDPAFADELQQQVAANIEMMRRPLRLH